MHFIGDVHGKWLEYFGLIKLYPESIQVGDFGFGFRPSPKPWDLNHKFIRGNHDEPAACRAHPNYLGEYGVYKGMFFVGGAFSIDYAWRQGHNLFNPNQQVWWADEEIVQSEFEKILGLYEETKPRIVVSHDAPDIVKKHMTGGNIEYKKMYLNRTSNGLMPAMLKIHQPEVWVFGHYHCSAKVRIDQTLFIVLGKLEVVEVKNE